MNGEYRDRVGDWNTETNRLYNIYGDAYDRAANDYYANREYATNLYQTEKKIPRILESPVLILKSKNKIKNNTRIVVFGTIKSEKGNPIIAILDLRPSEKNLVIDGMQKVTSSYAKSTNPAEFVSDSEVLYLEKKKAISLLRTIGFHSPIELNETDFIGKNIISESICQH